MEIVFAIFLLEAITGLSSSIFIIICLFKNGLQMKNNSPLNKILIFLNVSNVFFTIIASSYLFTSSLWPYFFSLRSVFYTISYMTAYSIASSSWITAILCCFYLMKIIPPRPGVLMKIKNNIGAIAWSLILMVETVSVGGSFLSILIKLPNPNEKNSTMNEVGLLEGTRRQTMKLSYIVLILNGLPFIVIILTTVGSAWFLRVYNHQMKKINGTLVNTNVKDYRGVVRTMMGLLIFYLFVIFSAIVLALEIFTSRSEGFWVCSVLLLAFPTGQSAFIIYSNRKLKEALRKLITFLICRHSGQEGFLNT